MAFLPSSDPTKAGISAGSIKVMINKMYARKKFTQNSTLEPYMCSVHILLYYLLEMFRNNSLFFSFLERCMEDWF